VVYSRAAATMGIHYAEEFPVDLADQEKAEIMDVYGTLPSPGKFPKGMDAHSLGIPKLAK